jgi:hypothetical protein
VWRAWDEGNPRYFLSSSIKELTSAARAASEDVKTEYDVRGTIVRLCETGGQYREVVALRDVSVDVAQ